MEKWILNFEITGHFFIFTKYEIKIQQNMRKNLVFLIIMITCIFNKGNSQLEYIDVKEITDELNQNCDGLLKKVFPNVKFILQEGNTRPPCNRIVAQFGTFPNFGLYLESTEYLFREVIKTIKVSASLQERMKIYLILSYYKDGRIVQIIPKTSIKRGNEKEISADVIINENLIKRFTFIFNEPNQLVEYYVLDLQTDIQTGTKIE